MHDFLPEFVGFCIEAAFELVVGQSIEAWRMQRKQVRFSALWRARLQQNPLSIS
jgi:hypothetical protein